jgi:hypothetical protein
LKKFFTVLSDSKTSLHHRTEFLCNSSTNPPPEVGIHTITESLGEKKKEQRRFKSEKKKRKFIDSVRNNKSLTRSSEEIHEDPLRILA